MAEQKELDEKLSTLLRAVAEIATTRRSSAEWLELAYNNGLLRMDQLEVGKYYYGRCRNAYVAKWDGQKFWYIRSKFGERYREWINHPSDDNGYDLFLPVGEVTPLPDQEVSDERNTHEKEN